MDYISLIRQPIASELNDFKDLFDRSLSHSDGLLSQALSHIRQRAGKRMRPMLILLMAKCNGGESEERRGQASVNEVYGNKVAVLVGDYILSTALLHISYTHNEVIVRYLAELGRTLSNGEILQLQNVHSKDFSEEAYYQVIRQKTAALFEACAAMGALSGGAKEEEVEYAKQFGSNLGVIFQIRDDIFDYYDQSEIGKPTGNDMAEGKLTLPALYALNSTHDKEMTEIAYKVKDGTVSKDEIARLVNFTKVNGGIDYAEKKMWELHASSMVLLDKEVEDGPVKDSLKAYLDYVIERNL